MTRTPYKKEPRMSKAKPEKRPIPEAPEWAHLGKAHGMLQAVRGVKP
jgi:hypothetical protein